MSDIDNSQKILVTGGAGYIGSILVPELLNLGYHVTVVDNFFYKQNSLNHVCYHRNFEVVRGDVRVKNTIEPLLKKADVILPLAALVGAPLCKQDPVTANSTNYEAIMTMLKLVSNDQVILMPTSNSAYGSGDSNNHCDETSPLNPISQYAIEKVKVEDALMSRPNSISYRLATVFGMSPRMRIDLLVNDFVYKAVNDRSLLMFEGHFKRNYIHVRDVTKAFIHSLNNYSSMKDEIYNVGLSDANLSKIELCEKIKQQLPEFTYLEAEFGKDTDQRNYIVSNKKIEAAGFKPDYDLETGIAELIKGYTMLKNTKYGNI